MSTAAGASEGGEAAEAPPAGPSSSPTGGWPCGSSPEACSGLRGPACESDAARDAEEDAGDCGGATALVMRNPSMKPSAIPAAQIIRFFDIVRRRISAAEFKVRSSKT